MDISLGRFQPRLAPTVAMLVAIVILLTLGSWQMQRLAWKNGLIDARETAMAAAPVDLPASADEWSAFDFRNVSVSGRFRHDLEQLYGAEAISNELGHHVLTPLIRADGTALLVDRGWVPADRTHPAARRDGQIEGEVTLRGIARDRTGHVVSAFTPDNQPAERLWYSYDLDAMETALGMALLPIVLEADGTANPGGLPRGGRTRITLSNNHLQYAITWYGLAAALFAVYIAFSLRPQPASES